jgi:hypothetical protein
MELFCKTCKEGAGTLYYGQCYYCANPHLTADDCCLYCPGEVVAHDLCKTHLSEMDEDELAMS